MLELSSEGGGGGLPGFGRALAEGGDHFPGAFESGGHGQSGEAFEVVLAVVAGHVPDHGNLSAELGRAEQAGDGELLAVRFIHGDPIDTIIDVKLAGGGGVVVEGAGERRVGCGVFSGDERRNSGLPGVHEVIDQGERHGFFGFDGGGFDQLVVAQFDTVVQMKVANAGVAFETEGSADKGFSWVGDGLTIQCEGEGLQWLGFVFEVGGADEADIGEGEDGAVGAALGGHGGTPKVDAARCPLGALAEQKGHVAASDGDGGKVGAEIGFEGFFGCGWACEGEAEQKGDVKEARHGHGSNEVAWGGGLGKLSGEFGDHFRMIGGEVLGFVGIVGQVEQLDAGGRVFFGGSGDQTPAIGAQGALVLRPEPASGFVGGVGGIVQLGEEAAAIEIGGWGELAEVGEGGEDVHGLDDGVADFSWLWEARKPNEQRGTQRLLVEAVLAPDGVLAQQETVIAPDDDDGVLGEAGLVQGVEHSPDLRVQVADAGGVGLAELAGVAGIGGGVALVGVAVVAAELAAAVPARGPIGFLGGVGAEFGDVALVKGVPLERSGEGEVRFEEADGEEERAITGGQGFEGVNRFSRDPGIGVGFVGAVEGFERWRFAGLAGPAIGVAVHDGLWGLPGALRDPGFVPNARQFFWALRPAFAGEIAGVVTDFAEGKGLIAALFENANQALIGPIG